MNSQNVLAVVTSHGVYDDGEKTGLWLSELSHFYDILTAAGYTVTIASSKGGVVPLDPVSIKPSYLDASARAFLEDSKKKAMLEQTQKLSDIKPSEYAAVFFAGGHGTMWDFRGDRSVQELITTAYESGAVIAAVCHGVAALVDATDGAGNPLVHGKFVTGYSTLEEKLIGKGGKVPYLLESELNTRGALYSRGWLPFTPYVVVDGRIVTGQNPQSTKRMSRLLVRVLAGSRQTRLSNKKCFVCLFGTWAVGLFAVVWGIAALAGLAAFLSSPVLGVVIGILGLGFIWYQYPLRPCSRCAATARTHASLGAGQI